MTFPHSPIETLRSLYSLETDLIPNYRDYARGKQRCTLTQKQQLMLAGVDHFGRADNICHPVISEAVGRLSLVSPKDRQASEEVWVNNAKVQAFIDELFIKERLDDLQGEVYYNVLRDGNLGVRVQWETTSDTTPYGRIRLYLEPWWDGVQGVFIHAGDDRQEAFCLKEWIENRDPSNSPPVTTDNPVVSTWPEGLIQRTRRTIWFEDRIEQWVSNAGGVWETYAPDEPWVKSNNSPLHIPVIHFSNAGRMFGPYGVSELSGGVLAEQDDLNDLAASIMAAARFTGFSVLWAKGVTLGLDKDGNPEKPTLEIAAGDILMDGSPDFAVNRIEPGSIDALLQAKDDKINSICRSTRTPRHSITGGDWPSGEALERAERPSVDKAKSQTAKFGPAWATVFHRAVEQANVFGKAGLDENAPIQVTWASVERRDPTYDLSLERQRVELDNLKKGVVPGQQEMAA